MATKSSKPLIGSSTDAQRESRALFKAQAEQRGKSNVLLSPDDLAGDYDAGRLLSTTLGGVRRPITDADLEMFRRKALALGKKFKGGITIKQIIENSTSDDRGRSNKEIRVAMPVRRTGNTVDFVTNAGPNSIHTRHHVKVKLMNLDSAIAMPTKATEAVKLVTAGYIKFDCSCEHHRYRLRYLATIGKYNAGNAEPAYTKITNPRLIGVACKHVLRVVHQLGMPIMRQYIAKAIEDGRRDVAPKTVATRKKDQQALEKELAAKSHHKRNRVESASERNDRLAQQRAVKAVADKARARTKTVNPARIDRERNSAEQKLRLLAQMGGITEKQLQKMLTTLKGK